MKITLRKACSKDHPALQKMFKITDDFHIKLYPKTFRKVKGPERPEKYLQKFTSGKDAAIFMAFSGSTPAGFVTVEKASTPPIPVLIPRTFAMITDIVVDSRYRNMGIALKLMSKADSWAKAKGLKEIDLAVYSDNEVAISLYKKLGYCFVKLGMSKKLSIDKK